MGKLTAVLLCALALTACDHSTLDGRQLVRVCGSKDFHGQIWRIGDQFFWSYDISSPDRWPIAPGTPLDEICPAGRAALKDQGSNQ